MLSPHLPFSHSLSLNFLPPLPSSPSFSKHTSPSHFLGPLLPLSPLTPLSPSPPSLFLSFLHFRNSHLPSSPLFLTPLLFFLYPSLFPSTSLPHPPPPTPPSPSVPRIIAHDRVAQPLFLDLPWIHRQRESPWPAFVISGSLSDEERTAGPRPREQKTK